MLGPYYESVYRPLNHDKKEVRFLKISRTSQSDGSGASIECTLCTESLETDVEFEAISYVWGDPHDTKTITVDGYSFAVTRNAFEVLHMLPAKYASLPYLWIDAICIKQDDNMEKNYQVPLMGDIYRQARNVHIWLGPTVSSEDVFQSVLDRMDAEESLDSVFADTTFYQIYDDILPCSWWDRLWVVQEALLASNATFHIGRITVSWYHMRALCKHLCEILVGGFGHVDELEGPIGVFMQVSNIVTLFAYHSGSNVIPLDGKSIFRILKLMNGKLVTDERDRVYGTMALLPP